MGKWMVNGLEKVQHLSYIVILIYCGFHNSILIVQFKRIINFISIIGLRLCSAFPYIV